MKPTHIVIQKDTGKYLKELPSMEKPDANDFTPDNMQLGTSSKYDAAYNEWRNHLSSLQEIQIAKEHEAYWNIGDKVCEWEFEVHMQPIEGWMPTYNNPDDPPTEIFAIPKKKEEKTINIPESLFDELIEYFDDKSDADGDSEGFHPNKEMQILSQLQHYTLTKK